MSSSTAHLLPNQSPPPVSKPASGTASPTALFPPPKLALNVEYDDDAAPEVTTLSFKNNRINGTGTVAVTAVPTIADPFMSEYGPSSSAWTPSDREMLSSSNGDTRAAPLPSVISNLPSPPTKKTTFRRLPAKCRNSQATTHSRNASSSSVQPQTINSPQRAVKSLSVAESTSPDPAGVSPPSKIQETVSRSSQPSVTYTSQILPVDSPSILKLSSSTTAGNGLALHDKPLPLIQSTLLRKSPYRPGFQPKGVYRPLTDDFLEIRRSNLDGEGDGGMKRMERTKLERRLEKLIALHFPPLGDAHEKMRPRIRPLSHSSRRASIFDFGSLKNINISDAGDLWKGIVSGKVMETAKNETRGRCSPFQLVLRVF